MLVARHALALRLRTGLMGLLDFSNARQPRELLLGRVEAAREWEVLLLTMGAGACRVGSGRGLQRLAFSRVAQARRRWVRRGIDDSGHTWSAPGTQGRLPSLAISTVG